MLPLSSSPAKIPSTTNFLSWRREIKIEEREREKYARCIDKSSHAVHLDEGRIRTSVRVVFHPFSSRFDGVASGVNGNPSIGPPLFIVTVHASARFPRKQNGNRLRVDPFGFEFRRF